jgi:hypothetical protein
LQEIVIFFIEASQMPADEKSAANSSTTGTVLTLKRCDRASLVARCSLWRRFTAIADALARNDLTRSIAGLER